MVDGKWVAGLEGLTSFSKRRLNVLGERNKNTSEAIQRSVVSSGCGKKEVCCGEERMERKECGRLR